MTRGLSRRTRIAVGICVALAAILVVVLVVYELGEPRKQVTASWLVDTDIPANINDGSQPAQGPDGVRHRVLSCEQVEGDLVYQVRFDNPYDRELGAVVATALDVGDRGSIWGFFKVSLPPGSVRAVFDTANIPMPEREALLHQTLPLITHPIEECSAHLLGFYEGAEFHIVFPVAYKKFGSDFAPTD